MSITNTSWRSDRHLGFVFFTSKCVWCQKSKALQGLQNKKIETLSWDFNRCCIATLLIWKNNNLQMSHTKMHIPKTVKPFFPPTRLDYTQLDYLVLVVFYYSWVPSQCALGRYSNMAEGPRTSFVCDTKNTTMEEFKGDSTVYLLLLCWAIVLVFVQPFPLLRSCCHDSLSDATDWPVGTMQSVGVTFSSRFRSLGTLKKLKTE